MSGPLPADEVRRRFARTDLAPLWQALRSRYESGRPVTSVRVGPMDAGQRAALADLLGRARLPAPYAAVAVQILDRVLVGATGHDTRAVVETLGGPLGDRAAGRARERLAREELWGWLSAHPVVRAEPALDDWVAAVRQQGVSASALPDRRRQLEQAVAVLAALPFDGRPLSTFADLVLGDTHALDDGTALSGLVLRALAVLHGAPEPGDAEHRRALWEAAGVASDALSTTVLVAGLHPDGSDPVSRSLAVLAGVGQVASVTLAQLRTVPRLAAAVGTVWVAENPAVLALAASRLGAACPPLVCTSGWPNGAVVLLLRLLRDAGAVLRYHGDLDGEGLRIAAYVRAKTGAAFWRMTAEDYLDAVAAADGPTAAGVGRVTDAPWDARLAPALREHGVAVPEERVADLLVFDLAAATRG